ncbi:tRNA uridine-5-carboxymethylaminomethyl(34) synthesis GTPase MnmE [Hutsoniella sourekii]|uniref:tRNA uridine-5-carboxymethylaminomethyl(34) synthesis GTPase MnmE n=1 Tax=Hutsoniella sourekii TaxID=87650 RepID=UPI0004877539|nr:tRNA uridine-5-carboxymethylaminomethyl(34) synthesis GTPase MnmE [Hutsoniella sourekii]
MYEADTIAAISTALGEGAIGIVRLSGPEAIEIADRISKGKNLTKVESHTINYGHIVNPQTQATIDEVMISVMKAPRSYTCEDVVEINCHGGIIAVRSILDLVLDEGARLAEPGEFTKRAFLNGRIDLSQAEAVMDLIESKTELARQASVNQLQGSLSDKISQLRQKMLNTLAQVEVTIDYPEYDEVEELSTQKLQQTAQDVQTDLKNILNQASQGRLFREGIQTAIIGRPNVGKSSLLNRLLGSEKAIVTDIEGTTRDTIEEYLNLGGVPLKLVDTAGIRETDELVEQIGVEKSRQLILEADLIILILNQAEELQATDIDLLKQTQDQARIILLNKSDLDQKIDENQLKKYSQPSEWIPTSMALDANVDQIQAAIQAKFFQGEVQAQDVNYLLNSRHTHLLRQANQALEEVQEACEMSLPVDLIQIDFTRAWDLLGEIIGESFQDELLDKLFSQFCLGK